MFIFHEPEYMKITNPDSRRPFTNRYYIQNLFLSFPKLNKNAFDVCKRRFLCSSVNNHGTDLAQTLRYSMNLRFYECYRTKCLVSRQFHQ